MADAPEPVEVTVVVGDKELVAGTLWVHARQGQSAIFHYNQGYLAHPLAHELDPTLPLVSGVIQTGPGKAMFNAFADSAPDRWGQNLMRRQERDRATAVGTRPRTLTNADFLLGTHDQLRQGAVRLRRPGTTDYWSEAPRGVPRLVSLPRLLDASEHLSSDDPDTQAISDLVNAGSSLGGARPKVSVLTNRGELAIAKFPHRGGDEWDVPGWEKLEADLAVRAGITVATTELVQVQGRNVLVSHRFDRDGGRRVGFASALTMLEASDGDRRSYLEIAEVAEVHSPQADTDLVELYRRIAFCALTANTDDHLRNHGFLRTTNGWRLAPAYDLNPTPTIPATSPPPSTSTTVPATSTSSSRSLATSGSPTTRPRRSSQKSRWPPGIGGATPTRSACPPPTSPTWSKPSTTSSAPTPHGSVGRKPRSRAPTRNQEQVPTDRSRALPTDGSPTGPPREQDLELEETGA